MASTDPEDRTARAGGPAVDPWLVLIGVIGLLIGFALALALVG